MPYRQVQGEGWETEAGLPFKDFSLCTGFVACRGVCQFFLSLAVSYGWLAAARSFSLQNLRITSGSPAWTFSNLFFSSSGQPPGERWSAGHPAGSRRSGPSLLIVNISVAGVFIAPFFGCYPIKQVVWLL
uniref:Uncharacterized protein n=1 Tax=Malurus cyaneus samueli TaxID=2593467 RepID=A0A8C5TAI8_9PASS